MFKLINHKKTLHPYSLAMLGLLIVSVNFGTVLRIAGINISNFVSILFIASYLYENNMKIYIETEKNKCAIVLFLIWILYGLVQIIIVKDLELFFGFYSILVNNAFLFISILLVVGNEYEFRFILHIVTLCIWMNIIASGWEYFSGNIIVSQKYLLADRQYIAGFIGNFNDFCTYMYFGCILFLIQLYFSNHKFEKIFCIVGIVLSVSIILFDGARGGVFSIVLFVPCFILFMIIDKSMVSESVSRFIYMIIFLCVFLFAYFTIKTNGIYETLAFLDRSDGGDIVSDRGRLSLIISCLRATLDTLGFGVGPGQSNIVCGGINVHNFYIEILCEYGVLICMFVIYLSFWVPMQRKFNMPPYLNAVTQSFAVTFIIASVTSSSINKMRMLWIFLALIFIMKNRIFSKE